MSAASAKALNNVLSNYYALFVKTQGYHWNITGSHFLDLHAFFQTQYEFMFTSVDEIAERMRALQFFAPGGLSEMQSISRVLDGNKDKNWTQIVGELEIDHKNLCIMMKEVISLCEKEDDVATIDLMTKLIVEHEKQIWMMHSMLESDKK